MRRVADQTLRYYPTKADRCSYRDVIDRYSGSKKRIYYQARENIFSNVRTNIAHVKAFIKLDKVPIGKIATKAPRMIQGRTPEYNLSVLRYLVPYEHAVYTSLTYNVISQTRIIAKGLNPQQRAELFISKSKYFTNPLYISGDHKAFDAHVTIDHLQNTHRKYYRAIKSKYFRRLMRMQYHNNCMTKNGLRYRVHGTRMSGDPDTGLGNSLINADSIHHVFGHLKHDVLLDGDDFLVIIEYGDKDNFDRRGFEQFGFETDLAYSRDLQQAEFCQSRIVHTPYRSTFVRNPERCLSHMRVMRHSTNSFGILRWLSAVAACENSLYGDMPIYNVFYPSLYTVAHVLDTDMIRRMQGTTVNLCEMKVDDSTRISFEQAWGVPAEVQIELEEYLYRTNMHDTGQHAAEQPISPESPFKFIAECSSSGWWHGS